MEQAPTSQTEEEFVCPDRFPVDSSPESVKLRETMLLYSPSNRYFLDWVKRYYGDYLPLMITYAWNINQKTGTKAYAYLQYDSQRQQTSGVESSQALFIRLFAEYFTQLSRRP